MSEREIFRKYGEKGITEYELTNGKALISDDTQMTLFTATGLMLGTTRGMMRGIMASYSSYINYSYLDWLKTQEQRYPLPNEYHYSWLVNIPELFNRRAPGNTCLHALRSGGNGSPEEPINDSKGCGGVMRVSPIGLYFIGSHLDMKGICRIGMETAALTHGHPHGWMPAAVLVQIIHDISRDDASILDAVLHALCTLNQICPAGKERDDFINLIRKAIRLASESTDDIKSIHQLGEGWVGDEALAIAVYCALKHSGDIDRALIAAVNHSGDSDSTGAITGNIIGAQVGLSGIPEKYTRDLELRDLIIDIADDLWADCRMSEYGRERDPIWIKKYVDMTYGKNE